MVALQMNIQGNCDDPGCSNNGNPCSKYLWDDEGCFWFVCPVCGQESNEANPEPKYLDPVTHHFIDEYEDDEQFGL